MSWVIRMLRGVLVYLNMIFLFFLTVWALGAILLTLTHITLTLGKTPCWFVQWFPNWILGWFGTDSAKLIAEQIYAVIVADMIAICAFVFAVVPAIQAAIYKINLKRRLRNAHGLEVFKVKNEGMDDLDKMLECYNRADHITVFCGDFDWLQATNIKDTEKYKLSSDKDKKKYDKKAEKMMKFVTDYAGNKKITLVSSKSIDLVREALRKKNTRGNQRSLFDSLESRFVFNCSIGIKCSLIKKINDEYAFLYRSHSGDKNHSFNAHMFTGATESKELINILRRLIESGPWQDNIGGHMEN